MKIDFMKQKMYTKDNNDIKLIIIDPTGNTYLTTLSNDGKNMKTEYNLDFYPNNYKCNYHNDYLQVFLNRYLKEKENYQKLLGLTTNAATFPIIDQLLKDGYIIFSNNTMYEGISYQINGTHGELYINWKTITKEQEIAISEIEEELSTFNRIDINKYLDYEKNIKERYLKTKYNSITSLLFNNKKKK